MRDSKSRGGNTVWVRPPSPAPKLYVDRPLVLGGKMPANQNMYQIIILLVFVAAMYLFLIKPQKKKDKETQDMRNSIQVGDEIVTIGGVCGKVVKTKDESIVIQVGADKTKLEFKRWAVSSVEKKAGPRTKEVEAPETKKSMPKRLGKKAESMEEEAAALTEAASLEAEAKVDSVVEQVESDVEA